MRTHYVARLQHNAERRVVNVDKLKLRLRTIAPALIIILGAEPAFAQDGRDFWRDILSGGGSGSSGRATSEARVSATDPPLAANYPIIDRGTLQATEAAIQGYQSIVSSGGWPRIPKGTTLRKGANEERVAALQRRLIASGDLRTRPSSAYYFDASVEDAVKNFQRRHGLTPSGKVYHTTLNALNVSAEERLAQLRINASRLRELVSKTGTGTYVMVNIPSYELQAVSGQRVHLYSRVVVGKTSTPTPELTAHIRAVNILPYWHVPRSIANRAIIPTLLKDPDYLRREHIRVFSAWHGRGTEIDPSQIHWFGQHEGKFIFRQDPGPFNALGVVRLDMANKHTVYMHDTPLKKLFKHDYRPYSAGCVRVQQVLNLAAWLIRDQGWDRTAIDQAVAAGEQRTVKLTKPVPVHFVYLTGWASENGSVHFRPDVYNKDGATALVASVHGTASPVARQNSSWHATVSTLAP